MSEQHGQYPVVTSYNFDPEIVVKICGSMEEAKEYLRNIAEEEYQIDVEENGWDSELVFEDDEMSAQLINHFPDHDDVTTFAIGRLID